MLDGVQRFAPAADDGAHAGAGEVHQEPAVLALGDLYLRLDAHAVQETAQETLGVRLDSLGVLRPGRGLGVSFRLLRLFRGRGLGGGALLSGGSLRGFFVRDLILHAHHRGRGAYAQKPALCTLDYLHGDVVPVQSQLAQGGGQGLVLGLAGLFKIFFHSLFS